MDDIPLIISHNIHDNCIEIICKLLHLEKSLFAHSVKIRPQTSRITLDQIRELKMSLYVARSKKQIIIFERFETATLEAQNAMLKLLEDTLGNNTYYLCTSEVFSIIDTIRSRCRVVTSPTSCIDSFKKLTSIDDLLNLKINALSLKNYQIPKRDDAVLTFRNLIEELKRYYVSGSLWSVKSARLAVQLYSLLLKNNINPQLAIDHWIISTLKFIDKDTVKS